MNYFKELISNHTLIVPVVAWAISQTIKIITNLFVERKFEFKRIFATGGMPSAHAATAVSLAVMCGWNMGFGSPVFALALLFSIVVIRDAVGVRLEAGKHAVSIKELASAVNKSLLSKDEEIRTEDFELHIGHTPLQVACGTIIGIFVPIVYILIFLA